MLTMADITASPNSDASDGIGIVLAFGIDDVVVHIMGTYVWFYELLMAGHEVVEVPTEDDTYQVAFMQGEEIVETLECSELLSALLRSEPQIVEVVREPKPSLEELGLKRFVDVGWVISSENEIIPPVDWVDPRTNRPQLTPEQQKLADKSIATGKSLMEVAQEDEQS